MLMADATLTIDGRKVHVTNLEITYDGDTFARNECRVNCEGILLNDNRITQEETAVEIAEKIIEETNMCRDRLDCDDGCAVKEDSRYSARELARRVKDLDLNDDDRLLRKYNVVNLDGTLTNSGKEVLLSVLFEQNQEEVLETLRALEAEEEKVE